MCNIFFVRPKLSLLMCANCLWFCCCLWLCYISFQCDLCLLSCNQHFKNLWGFLSAKKKLFWRKKNSSLMIFKAGIATNCFRDYHLNYNFSLNVTLNERNDDHHARTMSSIISEPLDSNSKLNFLCVLHKFMLLSLEIYANWSRFCSSLDKHQFFDYIGLCLQLCVCVCVFFRRRRRWTWKKKKKVYGDFMRANMKEMFFDHHHLDNQMTVWKVKMWRNFIHTHMCMFKSISW